MTSPFDVDERLAALVSGRHEAGERIVAAARDAGIGAVLEVGSLGAGGGDAFSDLDLVLVPGPTYTGLDLVRLFARQVLAEVTSPRNAPRGGAYTGLCLQVADVVLWLDVFEWPAATAAVSADAVIVYNNLRLPYSELGFVPLTDRQVDPSVPAYAPAAAAELLRIAVAARCLARGHRSRIVKTLPEAAAVPLDHVANMLREMLATIKDPGLARAVVGTAGLVDLADAARIRGVRR